VIVCPTEAILIGNLNDPESRVARFVNRDVVAVRRPEKETRPKLFYKGAHQATLDPLAAKRPEGGLFLWSEQGGPPHSVTSGHPGPANNVAAAMLAYDVPHSAPWGWHVSAYVWTKAIASGTYLIAAILMLMGGAPGLTSAIWTAGLFLALTVVFLIADLEHPERFYLILTRPQWRSWLVRGGVILTAFGAVIALQLVWPSRVVAIIGIPIAIATGTYTAWLFAQAKARDLWQSPLLAPQHFVACVMAGAATIAILGVHIGKLLAIVTAIHLALIVAEVLTPHVTAHARLAVHEMVRRRSFAIGFMLSLVGLATLLGGAPQPAAASLILLGLLGYEHAHITAAQAVPLA
jgi:polysulfide reductase-like protein